MPLTKRSDRTGIGSIQYGAISQDHTHAVEGAITVLGCTTAHAAGVVGGNAADFGCIDGCRIRTDLALEGGQVAVGMSTDDPRLEANGIGVLADLIPFPAVTELNQHRVGNGLSRQAGTGGTKGQWQLVCIGQSDQLNNLLFAFDSDHNLGNESIKAGIRAVGKGAQGIGNQACGRNEALQLLVKGVELGFHAFTIIGKTNWP